MRRRTSWLGVAAMAQQTPERWRLHPTMVAANRDFLRHAQRRARPLRPSKAGAYEFRTANHGEDQLGHPVFDVFVRWMPTREDSS